MGEIDKSIFTIHYSIAKNCYKNKVKEGLY